MNWASRSQKHLSRVFVLDGYRQKHAAIFMPGWDEEKQEAGQDVRLGLAQGNLDPAKPLIVVERDPEWAALIVQDLLGLGFTDLRPHVGELHDLSVSVPVDFVFIDLLGTLDHNISIWMRDVLAPHLTTDATVALSLAYCRRNNHFIEAAERAYNESFEVEVGEAREHFGISGNHRLIPIMLVRAIFNHHLFAFRRMVRYRDTNYSMMTFKFSDFTPLGQTNGSPSLSEVVSRFTIRERKLTMTDRSEAAHKAWETRRNRQTDQQAKAAQQARSDRAHRAWETRRAKRPETVSDRSAAALKAWETRRAQGWVHPARREAH